jgi:hypothetical protein
MKTNPSGPNGGVRKRPAGRLAGRAALATVLLGSIGALATAASATPAAKPLLRHATLTAPAGYSGAHYALHAKTAVLPFRNAPSRKTLAKEASSGSTVATSSANVVAGQNGGTYGFTVVGGAPWAGSAGTTTITANIIPVVVTDGASHNVYDPTTANSGCGESVSPITGMLSGPLLQNRRWYAGGTYVGTDQYTGAQMREEFWSWAHPGGASPGYHVRLAGSYPGYLSVTFNGGTEAYPGTCNALEEFPISAWDSYVRGLIPTLGSAGVNATTFPIFLFKNVVFTDSGCCILGYHSAFGSGGNTYTYGNTDYVTDGLFGASNDLAVASHEVSEWQNDPFVNNPTPPWGHIGQVSGCQGNLETGDPLTGTVFAVNGNTTPYSSNPIYHMQELALFGWFYDFNSGVNGWYSTRGTFGSGATLCS